MSGTSGSIFEDATQPVDVADTSITADVTFTGTATTLYTSCRSSGHGSDAGRGYYLGIGSDGAYYIQLIDSDTHSVTTLANGASGAIRTGDGAKDVLRADCIGSYRTVFANGQPVFQIYDDSLTAGNGGLGESVNPGPGTAVVSAISVFGEA